MRATSDVSTLTLTTARLEFTRNRRVETALGVATVVVLVALAGAIGWQRHADSQAPRAILTKLDQQNSVLREDVARTHAELELERSTRAALARQVAELDAENGELRRRLEFFNVQTGRANESR